jgi:glycine oxidase
MTTKPEIAIAGGGVIGLSIALRLQQSGARVTVVERGVPGGEASSAAAGILGAQSEIDRPGPLMDLCLSSRALYPEFARELAALSGIDVGHLPSGVLKLAFTEEERAALVATLSWQRALGLTASLLSDSELRREEPNLSDRCPAALLFPDDHQVDNRALLAALRISVIRAGVKLRAGSVRSVLLQGDRAVGLDVEGEPLGADGVVVAMGAWSSLLPGSGLEPHRVKPVKGQMLQLNTAAPTLSHILFSSRGYLVPRADGRVIAGSTMESTEFRKQVTAFGIRKLLDMAVEYCPALGNAELSDTWAGLRPCAQDCLPILGQGPIPGLYLATGHFRNGILLAPITAKRMAEEVLGGSAGAQLSPFRWHRF